MDYTSEILDYLNNQSKINKMSKFGQAFETNTRNFFDKVIKGDNDFLVECCAYLFGKALEIVISNKIYNNKKVPMLFGEIGGGIQINLPIHLQENIISLMDSCEKAVEKYMANGNNFDYGVMMTNIQYIAEQICNKHKIYDYMVGNYANANLLTPQMLYAFISNKIMPLLREQGFLLAQFVPNYFDPVNYVLKKGDDLYFVNVSIELHPRQPRFLGFKKEALAKAAAEHNGIPSILAVSVRPTDEVAQMFGVADKNTKFDFKMSKITDIRIQNA